MTIATAQSTTSDTSDAFAMNDANTPRTPLICGIIAGPLYLLTAMMQMLFRDGFDPTRHALSLMSLGRFGWIQIANFIVSGLLVTAAAYGARRAMGTGPGRTWGPVMLAVYGLSLIGAGVFIADPMQGFPPGTPPGPPETISWHGGLHLMAGGIGFLAVVAACMIFARRFASQGKRQWMAYSIATGVLFLASFIGVASGVEATAVMLAFWVGIALIWIWITALCAHLFHPRRSGVGKPS